MAHRFPSFCWLGLALCCACAGAPSASEPESDPSASDDGLLPPVFTAAEIKSATPAGRTYVWRFEAGGDVSIQRLRFVEVDEEGALTKSYADGHEGPEDRLAWVELEAHGRYPAATTTRERAEIQVPFGRFEGWLYTSRSPGELMEVWFADALPGAPIRQRIQRDGRQVFFMELLDHTVEPVRSASGR